MAFYLSPTEFRVLLYGLRSEASVRGIAATYVDGPVLNEGLIDLEFDAPGTHCFGIKQGGKECRFSGWRLTETRQGRRIDLEWERQSAAVVYEHKEAKE